MTRGTDVRLVPAALCAWGAAAWSVGLAPAGAARLLVMGLVLFTLTGAGGVVLWTAPGRSVIPVRWRPLLGQLIAVLFVSCAVICVVLIRSTHDVAVLLSRDSECATPGGPQCESGATEADLVGALASDPAPVSTPWQQSGWWTAHLDVRQFRRARGAAATGATGRVRLRVGSTTGTRTAACQQLSWGTVIRVRGTLAESFGVPGGERPSAADEPTVVVHDCAVLRGPPAWTRWSEVVRAGARDATRGLSPQGRGLVPGIAIGDTSELPESVAADMRTSSMTHMTAVSGAHFAILGGLIWVLLGWCRLPPRPRALVLLACVGALVILVRPEPSVVRAAVMAVVGVGAVLLRRPSTALPALAVTVMVLVVLDPPISRQVGFILSAAATAGLVLLGPVLDVRLQRLPSWLREPFGVALAAQLPCAPIVALLSPEVSVWAVPANTVAAVAVAPATVLGLLSAVVQLVFPGVAAVIAWAAAACTAVIADVARIAAMLPGAHLAWWAGSSGLVAMAAVSGLGVVLVVRAEDARWWWQERMPRYLLAAWVVWAGRYRRWVLSRVRGRLHE